MAMRMFAVAIRDGEDLFLWIRIRRAKDGDVYCMLATAREWKKWNPHGSHHESGESHYKSFGKIRRSSRRQKPDANFRGTEDFLTTDIRCDTVREVGRICNPKEFLEVMEVPATLISPKNPRETCVSVQLTEPDGKADIAPNCEILKQKAFKDSIPWILVSVG
jgi:hypothetical protein